MSYDDQQESIIRQHSQEMAIRWLALCGLPEEPREDGLKERLQEWTDWFAKDATPNAIPRQRPTQGRSNGQSKTGFVPPKPGQKMSQQDLFRKLIQAAGATADDVNTVVEYLDQTASGSRDGEISTAINALQDKATAGSVALELVKAAESWQTGQSGLPAPDEAGLA